jgi:hypothetical protein
MDLQEKKLYHQIHPFRLMTDIGSALMFLFFLWGRRLVLAIVVGFVPPVIVSVAMMIWPPGLERLKRSALGRYISKHMTPSIEVVRLLALVPMAWGAWVHNSWLIMLGCVILLLAWCNGLIVRPSS